MNRERPEHQGHQPRASLNAWFGEGRGAPRPAQAQRAGRLARLNFGHAVPVLLVVSGEDDRPGPWITRDRRQGIAGGRIRVAIQFTADKFRRSLAQMNKLCCRAEALRIGEPPIRDVTRCGAGHAGDALTSGDLSWQVPAVRSPSAKAADSTGGLGCRDPRRAAPDMFSWIPSQPVRVRHASLVCVRTTSLSRVFT